jgi:hypothetical protein
VGTLESGGSIKNLTITQVNIAGNNNVGAIAGINHGTIENVNVSGEVNGNNIVGGIVV